MANLIKTYQLIADILSFEASKLQLEKQLKDSKIDWDTLVQIGSKHLILPALYCRIQAKELISFLPKELSNYLQELTAINRNRNKAILKQAKALGQLLNEHQIDHVFLKGTALLASGYYNDIAERMVGDIDVLIDGLREKEAYDLVIKNGYDPIASTLGSDFFEHKHLPRLITNNHISALELHLKLFSNYDYDNLKPEDILKAKKQTNNINVPSHSHLLFHNILNHQINDEGYYYNYLDFRSAYDSIVLLRQKEITDYKHQLKEEPFNAYFQLISIFFNHLGEIFRSKSNFRSAIFEFRLKYPFWNKVHYKFLKLIDNLYILFHRLYMFCVNSKYRKAILEDKKRIFALVKNKLLLKPKKIST